MRKIIFSRAGRRGEGQAVGLPVVANHLTKEAAATRHFVYMVMCADGSLYTGYTTDPQRRVAEHNAGRGARYTRTRRPVELAFLEEADTMRAALRREIAIKKLNKNWKLLLCQKYRSSGKLGLR